MFKPQRKKKKLCTGTRKSYSPSLCSIQTRVSHPACSRHTICLPNTMLQGTLPSFRQRPRRSTLLPSPQLHRKAMLCNTYRDLSQVPTRFKLSLCFTQECQHIGNTRNGALRKLPLATKTNTKAQHQRRTHLGLKAN